MNLLRRSLESFVSFIQVTERYGLPITTNSVSAHDSGAVFVTVAGEPAGDDATRRRRSSCVLASAIVLPATVLTAPPEKKKFFVKDLYIRKYFSLITY